MKHTITKRVFSHLSEIAVALATTPEQVLESLIEQAYTARRDLLEAHCPWIISRDAVRCYHRFAGADEVEAEAALESAAVDAVGAEASGRRRPVPLASGLLRYRGPGPRRLVLLVKPGSPPVLVGVR